MSEIPAIIVDTDLGAWWDDATALVCANVLANRGVIRLVGVTANVAVPSTCQAIRVICDWYGNHDVPIGSAPGAAIPDERPVVADAIASGYVGDDDFPGAIELIVDLLDAVPCRSVTIVGLGSYTNLALLARDHRELVSDRIDRLVMMGGWFPDGAEPLTNQLIDPMATSMVVDEPGWPTPISWIDGTVGLETVVGSQIPSHFGDDHPLRRAYDAAFGGGSPTEGSWDAPAVVHAARAFNGLLAPYGRGGAARIGDRGGLCWRDDDPHRRDDDYLHVADQAALNDLIDELLLTR